MWKDEDVHEYMLEKTLKGDWVWKHMMEHTGRKRHELDQIWEYYRNHPKRIELRYRNSKRYYFDQIERLATAEKAILNEDFVNFVFCKTEGKIKFDEIKKLLKEGKSPKEIIEGIK